MNISRSSTIGARSDRILYLASLASSAKEIDHYLNPLRELIAIRSKDDNLTPQEEIVLDRVEHNIKEYLLTTEQLRSFTPETLEQHLYERIDAHRLIQRLRIRLAIILVLAAAAVLAAFMVSNGSLDVRLRVSINTAITVGYIIGAYLFLSSHRKFSVAHQTAYRLFSIAFIIGSIITFINLALTVVYSGVVPWSDFWYVTIVTYGTFALMYFGARRLALLYNIKSLAVRLWWILPLAIAGSAALTFFPWAWHPGARSGVNSIGAYFALVFAFHTAWLMCRVWMLASPLYKAPTKALGIGYICMSVSWAMIVLIPLAPASISTVFSTASSLLFIVCALCLVRAGYALSKLSNS